MPRQLTTQEFVEKQARNLKASIPDIKAGIAAVTEAPGVKAAAQSDKWIAKLQEAHTNGKWKDRVSAVSLADWKQKATDKGTARIAAGIDGAADKVGNFASQFLPHVYQAAESVNRMPNLTLEDGIAKASAMIRANANFKLRPK